MNILIERDLTEVDYKKFKKYKNEVKRLSKDFNKHTEEKKNLEKILIIILTNRIQISDYDVRNHIKTFSVFRTSVHTDNVVRLFNQFFIKFLVFYIPIRNDDSSFFHVTLKLIS